MSRTHHSQDYFDKPGIKLAVHGLNLLFTFPWAEREENETDIAKSYLRYSKEHRICFAVYAYGACFNERTFSPLVTTMKRKMFSSLITPVITGENEISFLSPP